MAERSSELENSEALNTDLAENMTTENNSLQTRTDDTALTEAQADDSSEEISPEADQIREQIVETRRGMSETIDAIQEKLSFANISDQVQTQVSEQINSAVETAKDAVYGKASDIVNSVGRGFKEIGKSDLAKKAQQNPTALAIIGAGIGALLVGILAGSGGKKKKKASYRYKNDSYNYEYEPNFRNNDSRSDDDVRYTDSPRRELTSSEPRKSEQTNYQPSRGKSADTSGSAFEPVSNAASSVYASAAGAADKTYEGVSNLAGKTYEGVGSLASKTYEGLGSAAGYTYEKAGDVGEQMKINYDYYIEENPLAVGAVALALGAAVGFAIPLTKKENEYMGEYRDSVLEKAQDAAQDAIGTVKQMATEAQKAITEEVKSKTA